MSKVKILVVDDEKSICDILEEYLSTKGFDVLTANDGYTAVEIVKKNNIGAVVCDIKMPGMDGIETAQEIKKIDQRIPVLIVTAYPNMDTAINALKSGVNDYLVKPVNLEEIYEKVSRVLSIRRVLEENVLFSKIVSLHEVSRSLSTIHDFSKLVDMVLEYSVKVSKADSGILMILNEKNELRVLSTIGEDKEVKFAEKDMMRIASWVAQNEEPLLINSNAPNVLFIDDLKQTDIGSSVSFPLKTPKRNVGVLQLNRSKHSETFTNIELEVINVLASHAAISIDNLTVYDKMQEQYLQTMGAFASAVEAKDSYTRGHSEQVMNYAVMLAEGLNLKKEEVELIRHAGLLHDIGKIGVPEGILNKPGKLTLSEFEEIKKHPKAGANIVSNIDSMSPLLPLIKYHHEKYNGRGYPDNLKGKEIPLGARILAVADAYDAMTSNRIYRNAMDVSKATTIIESELGEQFDPDIGKTFVDIIKKHDVK